MNGITALHAPVTKLEMMLEAKYKRVTSTMREVRKRELMIRDVAKSATNAEKKGEKKRKRGGKGIKKQETRGDTSTLRTREKKEKEKSECKVAPVFCDLPVAFRQTRPWSSFHGENTLDIHLAASFLLLLPFYPAPLPRFIIKIANPPCFFFFCYSTRTTNPFSPARSTVIIRTPDMIGSGVFPGAH